jgi:protein tyrosine/serine phosphatase
MAKRKPSIIKKLIVTAIIIAAIVLLVRHFHIKAFRPIESGVLYTSGQPRGMDYTRLRYKYHITTIVSIRPLSEKKEENWRSEEIVLCRNNGLNYIELPIERNNYFPDSSTQELFLSLMANKDNLPVLLHGAGDDKRVAMLAAVWLKKVKGFSAEQTLTAIQKIIENRPLTEQEKQFIEQINK